jgi:23S rRNA pseudouridine1911/1915/1917 synthase
MKRRARHGASSARRPSYLLRVRDSYTDGRAIAIPKSHGQNVGVTMNRNDDGVVVPPPRKRREAGVTKCLFVAEADSGERLDHFVGAHVPDLTRSQAKKLILDGFITVNDEVAKPSKVVSAGDKVVVHIPPLEEAVPAPEPIPLDVVYEDADLLVVDKPAGMVVHPAPGSTHGTLVNAILHHCDNALSVAGTKRPGIVHRLDKDTSGLLMVAKSDIGYRSLSKQVKERSVERMYLALVAGTFKESHGTIDAPIGRSISDRKRMAVTGVRGRTAITHFRLSESFDAASLLEVRLETGRTHQIRVHMAFTGHPILGDKKYGAGMKGRARYPQPVQTAIKGLKGQALHAAALGFVHPATGERMYFESPVRDDFEMLLSALRQNTSSA